MRPNKLKKKAWEESIPNFSRWGCRCSKSETRFIFRGQYVSIVWEVRPSHNVKGERQGQDFLRWFRLRPRSLSGMGRLGHPYSNLMLELRGDLNLKYAAIGMMESHPNGTVLDGSWIKSSLDLIDGDIDYTYHFWVNTKTGESVGSSSLPFFWRYLDYMRSTMEGSMN